MQFYEDYKATHRVKTARFAEWCDRNGFLFDRQPSESVRDYRTRLTKLKRKYYLETLEKEIEDATSLSEIKESLSRVVEFIRTEIYE